MTKPPADHQMRLARAHKAMREAHRGLSELDTAFRRRFSGSSPLMFFEIMPQRDVDFRAYIFFETDADIQKCEAAGINQEMRDFVTQALQRNRKEVRAVTVAFEFDSHENVLNNYEGSYYFRLR